MKKDQIFSVLRFLLMLAGGWLLGKNLLGNRIDATLWQEAVGMIMTLISGVWSYLDKEIDIEGAQSVLRKVLVFIGGLLIASGRITDQTLQSVLGVATVIVPWVLSTLSKKKNNLIANGKINTDDLKK